MDGAFEPLTRTRPTLAKPTLAKQRGIYRERAAPGALGGHVECLWSHRMPDAPPAPMAVVPDGCVDILWSDRGLVIAGPDRVAALPVIAGGANIVGLRFRPGVAASFLRTSLSEITGQIVPLDVFWGKEGRELDARLQDAPDTTRRADILADAVLRRLPAVSPPPGDVAVTLAYLRQSPDSPDHPIRALATATGTSERTLRRRCHEHFGYGAKTLDRILRLQRFLGACQREPSATLSLLALDAGYADQAHLSREARQLTSLSPAEIRRQLSVDRQAA
ncbi:helix-turn-helix domain-containing protein [Ensifer sp. SSB1]|jgi:AraC-like DNA-binding protein|uniref:helix-turn-helix domain-containing protein n=1 Tax=Ensifer sp. SSB1 TaxID=2795385 RepID=UPI001A6225A7|nr:helix-turn-helix domain-containing protein [Ensifer sp. SSB1]MBK5565558.1 AraC family transcriptional regulator [Ensifer sp. SSB1]